MGCDKPVVAAVTGAAIGIGTTMLLHCDFVYVSDEARLAMPFVSLGLVPEFASSLIVPQLMGNARAAEKLLLGDPFTGADAVELGIANAVLPAAEVLPHARRVAERFNALPPGAVRETKRLMRAPGGGRARRRSASRASVFGARLRSPEAQGGVQCLLPEAQARLLAVLSPPGAGRAAARASGAGPGLQARADAAAGGAGAARAPPGAGAARGGRKPRRARPGAATGRRCALLIAGDSSAAGVGVAHQDQAVAGHLVRALAAHRTGPIALARCAPAPASPRAPCSSCCARRRRRRPTSRSSSPASTTWSTRCRSRRALAQRARARRLAARRSGWRATSCSRRCRRCTSSRSCRSRCAAWSAPTRAATTGAGALGGDAQRRLGGDDRGRR